MRIDDYMKHKIQGDNSFRMRRGNIKNTTHDLIELMSLKYTKTSKEVSSIIILK